MSMKSLRSSALLAGLFLFVGSLLPVVVRGQGASSTHAQPLPSTHTFGPPTPTSGTPAECPALVQYAQTYTDCETFGNCSGARCNLRQLLSGSTAAVLVEEKCADPVVVEMNIDGSSPLDGFRGRFLVGGDGLHFVSNDSNPITADYGRDPSNLHYRAMTFVDGDQAMRLIPEITVPLFPGACMCQSMQEIARIIGFPTSIPLVTIDTSCSARSDCRGVNCNITISSIGNYFADLMVDPCGETVNFTAFDVNDHSSQFNRVFHDSGSYPFSVEGVGLQGSLIVGMVHHNYSMDLSVKLKLQSSTSIPLPVEDILPSHKVILDRSHCTNLTYYYNNGSTGETTTAPSPVTTATPPGLSNCSDAYIGTGGTTSCDVIANCSGVLCRSLSGGGGGGQTPASFVILEKCADPVLVDFSVAGRVLKKFSVGGLGSTEVVDNNSINIEYGRNTTHLHFKAVYKNSLTLLIPESQIPLHPHVCMCQSMDDIARNVHNLTVAPGVSIKPTCSKRPDCDGINCDLNVQGAPGNTAQIIIDPCQESVRVMIYNSSSRTEPMFNQSYDGKGGQYPLRFSDFIATELSVKIYHYNFSMQLSMELVAPTLSQDKLVLISPQKIILDRSSCSNIKYYPGPTTDHPPVRTSPSSGSGSQPSHPPPDGHSQHAVSLALVVGVPFGILLLVAVGLLAAILMVLALWRIRKRRRAYSFQRMTFTELDDDDKE